MKKEKSVLLINVCSEKLGFYEFVKPVGDILIRDGIKGFVRHYSCLKKKDLDNASHVIICGTTIFDNKFVSEIGEFGWVKKFNKPILGICSGMQILGMVFGGKLGRETEIGFYKENFSKKFLGLRGENEVYHLHNNYIKTPNVFLSYTEGEIPQAIKHKDRRVYGVLFHPEVRQKEMILEFCKL